MPLRRYWWTARWVMMSIGYLLVFFRPGLCYVNELKLSGEEASIQDPPFANSSSRSNVTAAVINASDEAMSEPPTSLAGLQALGPGRTLRFRGSERGGRGGVTGEGQRRRRLQQRHATSCDDDGACPELRQARGGGGGKRVLLSVRGLAVKGHHPPGRGHHTNRSARPSTVVIKQGFSWWQVVAISMTGIATGAGATAIVIVLLWFFYNHRRNLLAAREAAAKAQQEHTRRRKKHRKARGAPRSLPPDMRTQPSERTPSNAPEWPPGKAPKAPPPSRQDTPSGTYSPNPIRSSEAPAGPSPLGLSKYSGTGNPSAARGPNSPQSAGLPSETSSDYFEITDAEPTSSPQHRPRPAVEKSRAAQEASNTITMTAAPTDKPRTLPPRPLPSEGRTASRSLPFEPSPQPPPTPAVAKSKRTRAPSLSSGTRTPLPFKTPISDWWATSAEAPPGSPPQPHSAPTGRSHVDNYWNDSPRRDFGPPPPLSNLVNTPSQDRAAAAPRAFHSPPPFETATRPSPFSSNSPMGLGGGGESAKKTMTISIPQLATPFEMPASPIHSARSSRSLSWGGTEDPMSPHDGSVETPQSASLRLDVKAQRRLDTSMQWLNATPPEKVGGNRVRRAEESAGPDDSLKGR